MADLGTLTITLGVNAQGLMTAETQVKQFAEKVKKTATTVGTTLQEPFALFSKSAISHLALTSQRFRTFGYLASATVTAPLVLAGKSMMKMASEYEYAIQKIVGLTGTAQGTVNQWSKDIQNMAKEFGRRPQELAEGLYFIASSGIEGAEALDVLRLSAKAAASGLGETQVVANYLTSVLNAYRGTGLTAAYATDVLVAAVREGKAEATGFASAMGSLTPLASNLGVSLDQVAGAMAAITLTGSTSAQAATYLRGVFNVLMKETKQGTVAMDEASQALGQMKTSYGDLRKILREQGIMALMQKLNELSAAYGETLVSKVFPNIRAMLGVLSLSGKNMQYNSKIMQEITNSTGSLGKAFAAVSDTIKLRYDRALSSVNVTMIEIGKTVANAFLPILEGLAKKLNDVAKWFDSLTEAQKKNKIEMLLIVAAMGPVSLALSFIGYSLTGLMNIVNMLTKGFSSLFAVITGANVTTVLGRFGKFLVSPWGIAVAGITATTAAIIHFRNKSIEAAKEQTALAKTMVDVNGELKKLRDLTSTDYSSMTREALISTWQGINKSFDESKRKLIELYELAGVSRRDYERATSRLAGKEYEGPALSEKEATDILARVGKYKRVIDIETESTLGLKTALGQIENALKTVGTLTDVNIVEKLVPKDDLKTLEKARSILDQLAASSEAIKAIPKSEYLKALGMEQLAPAPKMPLGYLNRDYEWDVEEREKIMNKLATTLKFVTANEEALAQAQDTKKDLYNEVTGQVNAYSTALRELLQVDEENRDADWFKSLQAVTEGLKTTQQEFAKLEKLKTIANTLTQAFEEFFRSTIHGFKDFGQNILNMLEELIIKIVARFVVLKLLELFTGKKYDTLQFLMNQNLQAQNSMAQTSQTTGYAKGGIVPAGYPNDTYQARLSSGEAIIPLSRLNYILNGVGNDRQRGGEVVFRIEGDTLVGILGKQSKRNSIY